MAAATDRTAAAEKANSATTEAASANETSGCSAMDDVARLHGTMCTVSDAATCREQYVLLLVEGNQKYMAPREGGVVFAAVRHRFRQAGTVPLARIAWRVVAQRNDWVQLQHVMTGRWLRLVP